MALYKDSKKPSAPTSFDEESTMLLQIFVYLPYLFYIRSMIFLKAEVFIRLTDFYLFIMIIKRQKIILT